MRSLLGLLFVSGLFGQTVDLGPLTDAERSGAVTPIQHEQRSLRKTGIHRRLSSALTPGSRLRSAGAFGLRLHLTNFDAADGTLLVRGAGEPESAAIAYTGRGPNGDGEFWSHTVFGEELVVDFRPGPSGVALRWDVPEISHSFGPNGLATVNDPANPLRCFRDITCHAEWAESAKSVAKFTFEIAEGQASCTGALVRTKSGSGIPYFLTAHHCISDEQTARSVEAFWNYQTTSCNGKEPDPRNAIRSQPAGARFVVSRDTKQGDFSMIVLNSIPPVARFADYDQSELPLHSPIGSISHPLGSFKRFAAGEIYVPYWKFGGADFPQASYYQVRFTQGATHHGSSGSPLFSKPNTIAGMLSHGPEFDDVDICGQDPRVDGYAKLSLAWPDFSKYLEDPAPSSLTVSPAGLRLTVENGMVRDGLRRSLVVNSTSETPVAVSVNTVDPWVRIAKARGAAQAGSPFVTEIEFVPELLANRSGLLRSRVEVVSGNNGRVVPVDADIIVLASDVAVQAKPTAQPDAVDGCRYRLDLSLEEKAGVTTSLVALRINGDDYTDRLADWFGSTQLAGKGKLSTSLKVCWPGAIDPYQLIIAGRDSGSNRAWTQSTMIEFR